MSEGELLGGVRSTISKRPSYCHAPTHFPPTVFQLLPSCYGPFGHISSNGCVHLTALYNNFPWWFTVTYHFPLTTFHLNVGGLYTPTSTRKSIFKKSQAKNSKFTSKCTDNRTILADQGIKCLNVWWIHSRFGGLFCKLICVPLKWECPNRPHYLLNLDMSPQVTPCNSDNLISDLCFPCGRFGHISSNCSLDFLTPAWYNTPKWVLYFIFNLPFCSSALPRTAKKLIMPWNHWR